MNWLEIERLEGEAMSAAEAPKAPTAILDLRPSHKPGIAELLRSGQCSWHAFFDERAAIAEFEGRLTRVAAEARAFDCCVGEWRNRNPVCSTLDKCCWVGDAEREGMACSLSVSEAHATPACTAIAGSRGAIERLRRSLRRHDLGRKHPDTQENYDE
jgi:hypothetical protein